jgi:hypothetical protein
MENEFDYFIADENCKQAIKQLLSDANKVKWLRKYQKLLNKVIIQPEGLPEIVNCNLNGITYSFISEFYQEYRLVQLELTN